MSMKTIFNNFRGSDLSSAEPLQEVETREGFRNYKITMFLKMDKSANIDINQIFGKIRAIPGVITLRQEEAVVDRATYWLAEVTVKYNTRGNPSRNYIYNILVKQINSEKELEGIPGCKVYGINWQTLQEI
jgi:hypothetical protein